MRSDARFGTAVLGAASGLLGGLPLGAVLGHLVALAYAGTDGFLIGIASGAVAGSCCGLLAGLTPLFLRKTWLRISLAGATGVALGAYVAYANSLWVGTWLQAPAKLACLGGVAGAIHGVAIAGIVHAAARLRMRRRRAIGWEAPSASLLPEAGQPPGDAPQSLLTGEASTLQRQIRRAGSVVLAIRYLLPALAGAGVAALWLQLGGMWALLDAPVMLAAGLIVGLPLSLPLALLYRHLRGRSLRRQMGALPRESQAELLADLDDPDLAGTREFVRCLARDLRLAAEVSPAAAPDGRGDEAAGAEPER